MKKSFRYRATIAMPYVEQSRAFAVCIADEFCRHFGGATILQGTGFWDPNSVSPKDQLYTGSMVEPCRVVEVVVDQKNDRLVTDLIKRAAGTCKKDTGVDPKGQWVLLECEEITSEQFQI